MIGNITDEEIKQLRMAQLQLNEAQMALMLIGSPCSLTELPRKYVNVYYELKNLKRLKAVMILGAASVVLLWTFCIFQTIMALVK